MLILSRRKDESIVINGGIEIRIMGFQGKRVRLGISAPDQTKIQRAELCRDAISLVPDETSPETHITR